MRTVARLLGCTEGQAYTLVLGLALAVVLGAATVPAVMSHTAPRPVAPLPFEDLSRSPGAEPLTVVEGAYASAAPGTADRMPPEALPVGAEAGMDTYRSFLRLTGHSDTLRLGVLADRSLTHGEAGALIRMCPVTSPSWVARPDMALDEGPPYDCARSALGRRLDDGTWAFELGSFPERGGPRGFAVVPALPEPDGPRRGHGSFRVTFAAGDPAMEASLP